MEEVEDGRGREWRMWKMGGVENGGGGGRERETGRRSRWRKEGGE